MLPCLIDCSLPQLRPLALQPGQGIAELPEFRARGRTD
jgi:hypothetical protein